MQFMILFSWHPEKAQTPAAADLRESEFQTVRGLYTDGLVQQVWLRGDAGGACRLWKRLRLTKSRKSSARCLLSAKATCNLPQSCR
jgi:hypothetical protein